jgi:protein TonB
MAPAGLRRYLSGSVPISIGLHLFALFLVFVIPLTANIVLPIVTVELPDYVRLAPLPPPPAVAVVTPRRATDPVPNPALAPTVAPLKIPDEDPLPATVPFNDVVTPGAIPGVTGTPGGIGLTVPPPAVVQAPPPPRSGPVRAAELPVAPRKIVDARPVYPEIARQVRKEGTVVIEAVLDTNGNVTQPRVIQSVPLLDQAAIDAVRQWRYTPTTLGGHPVSVLMTITIRFTLQ